MKNTLTDLHNHLMAQVEALRDDSLEGDDLKSEIERSKAVSAVAKSIIENSRNVLEAKKLQIDQSRGPVSIPRMLTGDDGR
ncbi:MAG: hypothetical protein OXB97_04485 [Rhodospirillales bacterium]|nr:hypothetical protein [Rhodospirillales bacterium]